MPYSDTDEDYDLGNGPPMSRQVYDWYQKNVSPIGDRALDQLTKGAQSFTTIPSTIYKGLEWASQNVAAPALKSMNETYQTDWSQQPFIGIGEQGEFTGRLPALASYVTPFLAGGAPGGSATLPAGVKLPGGKYGYPEGLEGGYHGTHTVFAPAPENQLGQFMDKFINTGEGAQAYGWGHYVGAKKGTGASYMPSAESSSLHIGDQPWNPFQRSSDGYIHSPSAEQTAHDMLMDAPRIVTPNGHMPDVGVVVEDLKDSIETLTARYKLNNVKNPVTNELYYPQLVKENLRDLEHDKKVLDFIQSNEDKFKFDTPGSLYHVEMKPPEESLMHWDKKIREQEPEVQEKLKQVYEQLYPGINPRDKEGSWFLQGNKTGGDFYQEIKGRAQESRPDLTGNGQALSEAMKEAGIPGLRFADQQSRPVFQAKGEVDRVQANINKYQKVLDEDLQPGAKAYQSLMESEGGINNINNVRDAVQKEIAKEKLDLQMHQKIIRDKSTLQFDGKSIKTNDDVSEFVKADVAKHRALITVLEAKDVDTAINRIKGVIRVAADRDVATSGGDVSVANSRYAQELRSKNRIINEKAVEWLEENRDKFSLKEPDITHNYVIFDPKNLNPVHRERNMPKGYI